MSTRIDGVTPSVQQCLDRALRAIKVGGVQTDTITVERTLGFTAR